MSRFFGVALCVLAFTSCGTVDELADVALPIDQAQLIAEQVPLVLPAADLNGDGQVRGLGEWVAFGQALYAAVRAVLDAVDQ